MTGNLLRLLIPGWVLCCLVGTFTAQGNAGVFRGSGATVVLDSSEQIQMVEEEIVMTPMRGNWPIDESCRNCDWMRFECSFKLRNLSERVVTVPVGFPISTEAVSVRDSSTLSQADLAARFSFVAGTRDETFPVRFVPYDRERKFSNIFLWKMTFQPGEEVLLKVFYITGGYLGLGSTLRDPTKTVHYRHEYLHSLDYGIGEMQQYITETGGSWAGEIEQARFRIAPFEFEEYLATRGAFEESTGKRKERQTKRSSKKKNWMQMAFESNVPAPLVINWQPERSKWREVEVNRRRYLELTYAPFRPQGKADNLVFQYVFPAVPVTVQQFEMLLGCVREEWARKRQRALERNAAAREKSRQENPEAAVPDNGEPFSVPPDFTVQDEKNLADAVLEFYGIRRTNPEIQDFLDAQIWYPAETRPIDPALRERLEQAGRRQLD